MKFIDSYLSNKQFLSRLDKDSRAFLVADKSLTYLSAKVADFARKGKIDLGFMKFYAAKVKDFKDILYKKHKKLKTHIHQGIKDIDPFSEELPFTEEEMFSVVDYKDIFEYENLGMTEIEEKISDDNLREEINLLANSKPQHGKQN